MAYWKKKLIDDLNRKQFSGAISDTSGTEYIGVASADNQSFALKLPYGIAPVPCNNLTPKTLLAISTSFVQPNAPDAADRQWLCAAFATAPGKTEEARKLAAEAAKAKPQYRDQIDLLVPAQAATPPR